MAMVLLKFSVFLNAGHSWNYKIADALLRGESQHHSPRTQPWRRTCNPNSLRDCCIRSNQKPNEPWPRRNDHSRDCLHIRKPSRWRCHLQKKVRRNAPLKALRVVEVNDLVPKTTTKAYFQWMETYEHVGVELQIDHTLSPYLRRRRDPPHWHSLQCYLHLVDGHQGRNSNDSRSFELHRPRLRVCE